MGGSRIDVRVKILHWNPRLTFRPDDSPDSPRGGGASATFGDPRGPLIVGRIWSAYALRRHQRRSGSALPRCGHTTTEVAHIVPWAKVQGAYVRALMAPRPNCDTRFDKGEVDLATT
jgi:hypothetical protein